MAQIEDPIGELPEDPPLENPPPPPEWTAEQQAALVAAEQQLAALRAAQAAYVEQVLNPLQDRIFRALYNNSSPMSEVTANGMALWFCDLANSEAAASRLELIECFTALQQVPA